MSVTTATATNLRKDLFRHLDAVAAGQELEVTHKGAVLRIIPALRSSRLARLIGRPEAIGGGVKLEPGESGWDDAAQANWDAEQAKLFGGAE